MIGKTGQRLTQLQTAVQCTAKLQIRIDQLRGLLPEEDEPNCGTQELDATIDQLPDLPLKEDLLPEEDFEPKQWQRGPEEAQAFWNDARAQMRVDDDELCEVGEQRRHESEGKMRMPKRR